MGEAGRGGARPGTAPLRSAARPGGGGGRPRPCLPGEGWRRPEREMAAPPSPRGSPRRAARAPEGDSGEALRKRRRKGQRCPEGGEPELRGWASPLRVCLWCFRGAVHPSWSFTCYIIISSRPPCLTGLRTCLELRRTLTPPADPMTDGRGDYVLDVSFTATLSWCSEPPFPSPFAPLHS